MMKNLKTNILQGILLSVIMIAGMPGFAQKTEYNTDSLYAARLMQENLELYSQADSLNLLIKGFIISNNKQDQQLDSLRTAIAQIQADMAMAVTKADTLAQQRLRVKQELLAVKQQMLTISTILEQKLQLLRDQEFQLNNCQIKLREAQMAASLDQAKLEGKIGVNTAKSEAKDREIAYMQESIKEKNRIISEKTTELAAYYSEKSTSLRIVDSLSRSLNARELELQKVSERLRLIEGKYDEIIAQQTEAANRKKKIRFVQGIAMKNYRTPDYQLAPQSSSTPGVYVITNKNAGKIEFDYITGISITLYDLSVPDGKYTYDAGMFVGFGGTNFFRNFYIAPSIKAFDYIHFMLGLNIAEYEQLKSGYNEGDPLEPGMDIPTVYEWKANVFFAMSIDFELLSNVTKKM